MRKRNSPRVRLERYMEQNQFTQTTFGVAIDVSQPHINKLLRQANGVPSLLVATKIYRATGIRPEAWIDVVEAGG